MHLPARPICAVKGACKGVHRSGAQTLYSAGGAGCRIFEFNYEVTR